MEIPKKMKAVFQDAAGGELVVRECDVPVPGKGEVLVKMAYAPVNPSDLSFLQGTYAEKPQYPVIPGIEGSGIVVKAGGGLVPRLRLGKLVACTSTHGKGGTWAEYMVTSAMNVVPLGKGASLKQAATLIVNPLTALSFVQIAKSGKHRAVFNNAAGGALGKMLVQLANDSGIEVLSVVRSAKQMQSLKDAGASFVLDSSSYDFEKNLKAGIEKLKPTLFFDAVGGEQTKMLVEFSPKGSVIMPYAGLSEKDSCFNPRTLLQQEKRIEGFFLGSYTSKLNMLKVLALINRAKKLINSSLKTEISNVVSPENIKDALSAYAKQMSEGKILIEF